MDLFTLPWPASTTEGLLKARPAATGVSGRRYVVGRPAVNRPSRSADQATTECF